MKYTRQDLLQIIPSLRFGSSRPATTKFRWLTYTQIAALINCSVSHVRQISIDFAKKYDEQKAEERNRAREAGRRVIRVHNPGPTPADPSPSPVPSRAQMCISMGAMIRRGAGLRASVQTRRRSPAGGGQRAAA